MSKKVFEAALEAANVLAEAPKLPINTGDISVFIKEYTDWFVSRRIPALDVLEDLARHP